MVGFGLYLYCTMSAVKIVSIFALLSVFGVFKKTLWHSNPIYF